MITKKLRDKIVDAFRAGAGSVYSDNMHAIHIIDAGVQRAQSVMNASMCVKPRAKKPTAQPEIAPTTPGRGWRYLTQGEIRWRQKHIKRAEKDPVEMWLPRQQKWDPGAVGNVLDIIYRTRKSNPILHP